MSTNVTVPQKDGEIVMRRGGEEPRTYKVTDHTVAVEQVDVEWFCSNIDGSKPAGGITAVAPKKES